MDFGELLDEWDRRSAKPGGLEAADEAERRARAEEIERRQQRIREAGRKRSEDSRASLETWLSTHPVPDKDSGREGEDYPEGGSGTGQEGGRDAESRRLADLRPGARLDLHGKTVAEAEASLALFLEDAARRGIEKVLVITGKGNHSSEGPVLAKATRRFLEASPRAGRFGQAGRNDGGTGALWVLVRRGTVPRGR
jgi:DNA-nicking Smr family endonuclease